MLKMSVSLKRHNLGSRLDLDCWGLLDASNQVSRHAHRKTAGADEQMNMPRRLRQEHRGLAGRVRPAYDDDLIAVAELRFHEGRAVVDTRTFELTEIRERRPTVSSPSGNDHCASRDGHAVVESHAVGVVFAGQLRGAFCDHDLSAKLLGVGASGQLSTRNPGWKSKVVLDSRARARLPSRRVRLDNQRIESLGSRVDGGRKTRWSGTDDDDIAKVGVIDHLIEAEI